MANNNERVLSSFHVRLGYFLISEFKMAVALVVLDKMPFRLVGWHCLPVCIGTLSKETRGKGFWGVR